jgi:hypothetical protein
VQKTPAANKPATVVAQEHDWYKVTLYTGGRDFKVKYIKAASHTPANLEAASLARKEKAIHYDVGLASIDEIRQELNQ